MSDTISTAMADLLPLRPERNRSRPVIACLDGSGYAESVLDHAARLSRMTGAPLELLRVLDAPGSWNPPDPLDHALRRREALEDLRRRTGRARDSRELRHADVYVAEGCPAERIFDEATRRDAAILVLGRQGESAADGVSPPGLGATARAVIERARVPVFLVTESDVPPRAADGDPRAGYRRILVPLDGSPWAETALPAAEQLARRFDAELVLVQIVTPPQFTGHEPLDEATIRLRDEINERNRRVAQTYLEGRRAHLAQHGLAVRARVELDQDARDALTEIARAEEADLVVLAARGSGSRHLPGPALGSVASYLGRHSPAPLLMVPAHERARRRTRPFERRIPQRQDRPEIASPA